MAAGLDNSLTQSRSWFVQFTRWLLDMCRERTDQDTPDPLFLFLCLHAIRPTLLAALHIGNVLLLSLCILESEENLNPF